MKSTKQKDYIGINLNDFPKYRKELTMALNPSVAYVRSSFVQVVRDGDSAVIWHSLFGYPKVVPAETLEFLESFSMPKTICSQLGDELVDEDKEAIEELLRCYFLVPEDFDDRAFLGERMREREKEIVSGCNITQEFAQATKTAKIERMCDFYRRMTQEILREQLREAIASEPELLEVATERR